MHKVINQESAGVLPALRTVFMREIYLIFNKIGGPASGI